MNKLIHMSLTLATATLLVNCGGGESDSSTGGTNNSGKGSDKVTITKINDKKFDIVWEKGFSGYSELSYAWEGVPNLTVVSNNYKGTHTLHCNEDATFSSGRQFVCEGTGVAYDGSTMDIRKNLRLPTDTPTYFHRLTSTDKDDHGVDYVVTYHSNGLVTVE